MSILEPPQPHSPNYYEAPDLLRLFVSRFTHAKDAAVVLGVTPSELSTWLAWRQRPGDEKRSQIDERSRGGVVHIPRGAWLTKAERETTESPRA